VKGKKKTAPDGVRSQWDGLSWRVEMASVLMLTQFYAHAVPTKNQKAITI
jgi:hypothetical protein